MFNMINFGDLYSMETKYLKDYKKSSYEIKTVNLVIDLNDEFAKVKNFMHIVRTNNNDKNIEFDGHNLKLVQIKLDNKILDQDMYKLGEDSLVIENVPDEFDIEIENIIYPSKNTSLQGLYLADDNLYLTQCEPEGFRNISFYLDRPDVMSIFTVKLIADKKYKTLLSNGDLIESGEDENGKHFAVWYDKWKKPSYLFAAVFGDLNKISDVFVTKSGKKVDLEIYSSANDLNKSAYAMFSLKKAMKWDEDKFNREYDLARYMIVGTPKFNSGAMENKGLNIFNNVLIQATKDTATDFNYKAIMSVVGHEYFHNWTGNRITLRDWFQLSIKEGLTVFRDQEFSSDMFSRPIQRIEDVSSLTSSQFSEDSGALSHPVQPDSYKKIENFYTSTIYDKGAELIRMLKTIVGEKNFYAAMDLYFKNYDGKAVSKDDFIKPFEDITSIDLSQFKLWYSQAGTPTVKIIEKYDENKKLYTISLSQETLNHKENLPFFIPIKIGLISSKTNKPIKFKFNETEYEEIVLHFKEKTQDFILSNVIEKPILSFNRDFTSPILVKDNLTDDDLLNLLQFDNNEFNAWFYGREYFIRKIIDSYNDSKNNKKYKLPVIVKKVYEKILNSSYDDAFKAELISLPHYELVWNRIENLDPIILESSIADVKKQISEMLLESFLKNYDLINKELSKKPYNTDSKDMDKRSLKNIILYYISRANEKTGEDLAIKQLNKADNLTDRIAALNVILSSKNKELYNKYKNEFKEKWQNESLVILKWVSLVVAANRDDSAYQTSKLLNDDIFDITTPNMNYSVMRGFNNNLRLLYSEEGSEIFFNHLKAIDKINPKVASRFVRILSNWKNLDSKNKEMILKHLQASQKNTDISHDLKEIIDSLLK